METRLAVAVATGAVLLLGGVTGCGRDDASAKVAEAVAASRAEGTPGSSRAVHADWRGKALPDSVEKGLAWLLSVQGADGGFGQDGGKDTDARKGIGLESQGNDVANTCMVGLALLRAGAVPDLGRNEAAGPEGSVPPGKARGYALLRAVRFVLGHVEAAPAEGLAVTNREGTQVQRKLGRHIDTFLATRLLSQVDGLMPSADENQRVHAALAKCASKVEKGQGADGSWNDGSGWATVLSTSMASRGLAEAKDQGVPVGAAALERVSRWTAGQFDGAAGAFRADATAAGVPLYQLGQAAEQASRADEPAGMAEAMLHATDALLADDRLVSGFGSMGGEEFVSYMNVSDGLCRKGGDTWTKWNDKIRTHVERLQNADGTWAGHHCITGRVACTSAAVLTILAERSGPRS